MDTLSPSPLERDCLRVVVDPDVEVLKEVESEDTAETKRRVERVTNDIQVPHGPTEKRYRIDHRPRSRNRAHCSNQLNDRGFSQLKADLPGHVGMYHGQRRTGVQCHLDPVLPAMSKANGQNDHPSALEAVRCCHSTTTMPGGTAGPVKKAYVSISRTFMASVCTSDQLSL